VKWRPYKVPGLVLVLLTGLFYICFIHEWAKPEKPQQAAGSATGFPLILKDPYGHEVYLAKAPQRIVSLNLFTDEELVNMVSPSRLVGLTFHATNKKISNIWDRVKGFNATVGASKENIEQILSLKPDLITTAAFHKPAFVGTLRKLGLTVFQFKKFDSVEDLKQNLKWLGQLTGETEKAAGLIEEMNTVMAEVKSRLAQTKEHPRVLQFSYSGQTVNRDTLDGQLITLAGGKNVVEELNLTARRPKLAMEKILELNPDVLFASNYGAKDKNLTNLVQTHPAVRKLKAVKAKRFHILDGRYMSCISHYRVTRGLIPMAKIFHPELFSDK